MARLAAMFNVLDEAKHQDLRSLRKFARLVRYTNNAVNVDEDEFVRSYRFSKDLFFELVDELTPLMKTSSRQSDIHVMHKVLVALSFFATGSYQRLVGRNHGTLMSQQSVSRCIKEVTDALNNPTVLNKYIKFPATLQERNVIKTKFYAQYKIPGIIGCIDGTHVAMVRPHENEEWYFNRKQYHSRNVQIICDFDLNIMSVDASFGGATHDSHIFNQHMVKSHLMHLLSQGERVCLLGDSGYAQREYMMTPIVNASAGSPEEFYTNTHCSARNRVERTIGLLKARWRCLLKHRVLHYKPTMVAKIINACCVLHNMCNRVRQASPDLENVEYSLSQESQESQEHVEPAAPTVSDELQRGIEARNHIVQRLWNMRHNP